MDKVTVQKIWTPPGKKLPQFITTSETEEDGKERKRYRNTENKWANLFTLGATIEDVDWEWGKDGKGNPIRDIIGIGAERKIKDEPDAGKSRKQSYQDGQAIGRCWNDVRELIISGKLSQVFGKTTARKIALVYKVNLLSTLDIPYEEKEIQEFGKEGE